MVTRYFALRIMTVCGLAAYFPLIPNPPSGRRLLLFAAETDTLFFLFKISRTGNLFHPRTE